MPELHFEVRLNLYKVLINFIKPNKLTPLPQSTLIHQRDQLRKAQKSRRETRQLIQTWRKGKIMKIIKQERDRICK
jgi:hypothetical protein